MYTNIVTETDLGVGIITLNRPERHNAFDDALIAELSDAIERMEPRWCSRSSTSMPWASPMRATT